MRSFEIQVSEIPHLTAITCRCAIAWQHFSYIPYSLEKRQHSTYRACCWIPFRQQICTLIFDRQQLVRSRHNSCYMIIALPFCSAKSRWCIVNLNRKCDWFISKIFRTCCGFCLPEIYHHIYVLENFTAFCKSQQKVWLVYI